MKSQWFLVGLMGVAVSLVGAGCAPKETIRPELKLRDPETLDAETASAVDRKEEAVVGEALTARDFGVPDYPGARTIYTEKMGSPDTDGEFKMVQWATTDTPEQVTSFYEGKIGTEAKREAVAQGNSAMFVWPKASQPAQTLVVAEDSEGQTIITVQQTAMSKDNPLMLDTSTLRPGAAEPTGKPAQLER